jgi:energy-coupling factor transport system permease protein
VGSLALEGVLGQYLHRNSVMHRLDPRVKLLLLFGCIVLAFVADGLPGLAPLYALLLFCAALSRIPPLDILKAVAPLSLLLIFPVVFNIFFTAEGEVLLHVGPILITAGGIFRAIYMTLRLFFLFASMTLFTLTTSSIAISDAVGALLRPFARFGLPATELAMMVSIALRFVPLLVSSYEDIRAAQQARGADLTQRQPIARLRGLVSILVPLFAQAFHHAEELALAMESRCFHGGERTHYRELTMHRQDYLALAIVGLVAALLIVLRVVL